MSSDVFSSSERQSSDPLVASRPGQASCPGHPMDHFWEEMVDATLAFRLPAIPRRRVIVKSDG
jgi:hypothetical protein